MKNLISERPLVTFALFAYNQEKYIREAVEGAFSQTYEPLEIILSDDCSQDETFAVMEKMANDYKGKHRVTLNRNTCNLGLADHINKVVGLSSGKLIVLAAGDDISLPERTELIVQQWLQNKNIHLFYSSAIAISEAGEYLFIREDDQKVYSKSLEQILLEPNAYAHGASCALSREIFSVFGNLKSDIITEDSVWPARAKLIGEIFYINQPTIKYRQTVGISFSWEDPLKYPPYSEHRLKHHKREIALIEQRILDLKRLEKKHAHLLETLVKKYFLVKAQILTCNRKSSAFSIMNNALKSDKGFIFALALIFINKFMFIYKIYYLLKHHLISKRKNVSLPQIHKSKP